MSNNISSGGETPTAAIVIALLTRKQVADALQVCPHSVARYTRDGLLPCLKINRRVVRYQSDVVQKFIEAAKGGA